MGVAHYSTTDLDALAPQWDRAVEVTPDVDQFCASSVWSFSAAESFSDAGDPVIVGDGTAFCGMRPTGTPDGRDALVGLDPIWGFATPCVGPPEQAAAMLGHRIALAPEAIVVVSAQREDSIATAYIARVMGGYDLHRGPTEARLRAELSGGFEEWFRRRSSRFRQQTRRIERDAAAGGVVVRDHSSDDPDDVMDRILAIEATSWKGPEATGLSNPELSGFYRTMVRRLAPAGSLRVTFATVGGADIGYILGGVRGQTYRGLQIAYATDAAHRSIGHLLQLHTVRAMAAEGIATYDLGMDISYKRRWADHSHDTITIIAVPKAIRFPMSVGHYMPSGTIG